jgi:hemoglobin
MNYSIMAHNASFIPPVQKPNPSFLNEIEEQGIRDLLTRLYLCLDKSPIRGIFPPADTEGMLDAAQISADFFIQICGGPQYFNQNRGMPQMRGRHAPFAITPEGRLHWLSCFEEAIKPLEGKISEENLQSFWNYINIFSIMMINTQR